MECIFYNIENEMLQLIFYVIVCNRVISIGAMQFIFVKGMNEISIFYFMLSDDKRNIAF